MRHRRVTDEVLELTALYALGTMAPAEAGAFEAHLEAGCEVCAGELDAFNTTVLHLAASAAPMRPRSSLKDRLFRQIRSNEMVQRSAEMPWEAGGIAGLLLKKFFVDPLEKRFFALVQMAGGVVYPGHWHTDVEEMYMLGGHLHIDGKELQIGDYYAAPPGNIHDIVSGERGCNCLILSPEVDEPIESARAAPAPVKLEVRRAGEGQWSGCGVPGLTQRTLHTDAARGTTTALFRMEAGCRLPRHRHETAEQIYLVEGDARVEEHRMEAGDFYRIDGGTVHEVTSTRGGCTFLLVSSGLPVAA